tara:strand:- start:65 stop:310 length:246 start_codon:yes stop_codon:yes gene_type:complete
MRYLLSLIFLLTSCASIKEFSHGIDAEKQTQLVERASPVVGINLYHVSFLASLIATLVVCVWYVAWRKNQNKDADVSEESS